MASVVYILCALTAFVCAGLLYRGYRQSRVRLLLWSTICFTGLALNNVLLIVDRMVVPNDLSTIRLVPALIGVSAMIAGIVLEDL